MPETPRLPPLPSNFGNDSPFPPPIAAPKIPSAKYLASASAPPLPPLRDEALERELKQRQQEQYRMHAFASGASSGGLRPGQIIPSTAYAPAQQAPVATPPHFRIGSSPIPAPVPVRTYTPSSPRPPPKIALQQQQRTPHLNSPLPMIQRPATSEPRIPDTNNKPAMNATSTARRMEGTHHLNNTTGPSWDQRRRVSSEDGPRPFRTQTGQPRQTPPTDSSSSTPNLSVVLPDLDALGILREKALASGNDKKKLAWCKDVIRFVERKSEGTKISDPVLVQYIDESIGTINRLASGNPPIPEALYLRGDLLASGAFPTYHRKDLKAAFNDFELSARMGHNASWFRIGRDYEILGDCVRGRDAYERGCAMGDVGCIYRMGMANLLGQLSLSMNHDRAIPLLREAADLANLDTPQPSYIYGILLAGEFSHVEVAPRLLVLAPDPSRGSHHPPTIESEARRRIQRAAYLNFGPAQYRCGWSYEFAQIDCPFDPLLSVQYYSLASQAGEVEADLALSKWFLCGAESYFDKNEALAFTFAEKAARKGLPSAEFAMGYYFEVGVGCEKNIEIAQKWYKQASSHGNTDAKERLDALKGPSPSSLSRSQHEVHVDTQLQRKRTEAKMKSDRRSRLVMSKERRHPTDTSEQARMPSHTQQPTDVRRRMTMKMVEETAKRNYHPKSGQRSGSNSNPTQEWERRGSSPSPALPSTPARSQPGSPRITIPASASGPPSSGISPGPSPLSRPSPLGNTRPPPNKGLASSSGGMRTTKQNAGASKPASDGIAVKSNTSSDAQKQKFETFGDMGISSKKAKDDKDCIIC